MSQIKLLGISLIVVSAVLIVIGIATPHSSGYLYFTFVSTVAGFILVTGDKEAILGVVRPR